MTKPKSSEEPLAVEAPPDILLTVEDVAYRLGVSATSVRRYIHDKKIAGVVMAGGNRLRIRQSELEKLLREA